MIELDRPDRRDLGELAGPRVHVEAALDVRDDARTDEGAVGLDDLEVGLRLVVEAPRRRRLVEEPVGEEPASVLQDADPGAELEVEAGKVLDRGEEAVFEPREIGDLPEHHPLDDEPGRVLAVDRVARHRRGVGTVDGQVGDEVRPVPDLRGEVRRDGSGDRERVPGDARQQLEGGQLLAGADEATTRRCQRGRTDVPGAGRDPDDLPARGRGHEGSRVVGRAVRATEIVDRLDRALEAVCDRPDPLSFETAALCFNPAFFNS